MRSPSLLSVGKADDAAEETGASTRLTPASDQLVGLEIELAEIVGAAACGLDAVLLEPK
jgi:hypothetical protein